MSFPLVAEPLPWCPLKKRECGRL